jgi:hypothetical protein
MCFSRQPSDIQQRFDGLAGWLANRTQCPGHPRIQSGSPVSSVYLQGCGERICKIGAVKPASRRLDRLIRHRWPKGRKAHFLSSGTESVNTTPSGRIYPGNVSSRRQTAKWSSANSLNSHFPTTAFCSRYRKCPTTTVSPRHSW